VAVGGQEAVHRFAELADHLIATEPNRDLITARTDLREENGRAASRSIGQVPICWGWDKDDAVKRAHELFRWFGGGWAVNADLPVPAGFEGASSFVRPEDVAESIACGPDLDKLADSVRPFWEAGFTDVALVQIGDESQQHFLDDIAPALLERLRSAAP
jgi:G6PDH family F420-dependent oxidoreductase